MENRHQIIILCLIKRGRFIRKITEIFVHIQENRVPRYRVSRYCYWSRLSKGICYVYCFSFAPSSKRRSRGPISLLHSALRYPRLVDRSLFPRFFPAFSGARFFFNGCATWSSPVASYGIIWFSPVLRSRSRSASGFISIKLWLSGLWILFTRDAMIYMM